MPGSCATHWCTWVRVFFRDPHAATLLVCRAIPLVLYSNLRKGPEYGVRLTVYGPAMSKNNSRQGNSTVGVAQGNPIVPAMVLTTQATTCEWGINQMWTDSITIRTFKTFRNFKNRRNLSTVTDLYQFC